MRHNKLLDSLFSDIRQGVLSTLLLHPDRRWYRTKLSRHLGVTPSSLQRELVSLVKAGILTKTIEGRQVYYQADAECPIFNELQMLLIKTIGVIEVLKNTLVPFQNDIEVAFIYGSIAKGIEVHSSDIDLLVIGKISSYDIAGSLRKAGDSLSRPINTMWYSVQEYQDQLESKKHFLMNVMEEPKLFLIGDDSALVEIAGRATN